MNSSTWNRSDARPLLGTLDSYDHIATTWLTNTGESTTTARLVSRWAEFPTLVVAVLCCGRDLAAVVCELDPCAAVRAAVWDGAADGDDGGGGIGGAALLGGP